MKRNLNKNSGYITRIVLIIIALVFIKYYFDFDVVEWFKTPKIQKYVDLVWQATKNTYNWFDKIFSGWFSK